MKNQMSASPPAPHQPLKIETGISNEMAPYTFGAWLLLCLRLCVVSEARNTHARSSPRIVQSSLQIEYIRALKPYESLASNNGFEVASTSLVFAIFRVKFDRDMYVRRWNGTNMNDYPLPIATPIGDESFLRKHGSDDRADKVKTYHRRGLQSIAKMTCDGENETFYSHEHPNAYNILTSKHVPPEIFSLPSLGSDQLKYAEDAYFASQERNVTQRKSGPFSRAPGNRWEKNEYVAAMLLYNERPSGPGGYSSESAQAAIADDILPALPSFEDATWRKELRRKLQTCKMVFPRMNDQIYWPLGELVDTNGSTLANNVVNSWMFTRTGIDNAIKPKSSWSTIIELDNKLLKDKRNQRLKEKFDDIMAHYPSVLDSWNGAIPPMPNYCGVKDGHLSLHQVEALQAMHETAFIDEGLRMEATHRTLQNPIPDAPGIVEQVVNTLIPAVLEWFFSFFTERAGNRISDEMEHKILADTPRDVVKLLEPPLAFNISNLAVEALTASLTKSVSHAIVADLGPYVASMVAESLQGSISTDIKPFLENTIPNKVDEFVPDLLSRSLPVFISEQLTKSLTHSLVPTLTQSLSGTSDQYHFCQMCAQKSKYCNYCHSSPQGMYYIIYYSTYYSDWYSDYYAKYYTDALKKIDSAAHPGTECVDSDCTAQVPIQTAARLRNVGKLTDFGLAEEIRL